MDNSDIKTLIDEFIAFVDTGAARSADRDQELLMLLDSLALAQARGCAGCGSTNYPDPPDERDPSLRKRVQSAFKDYGYYNEVEVLRDDIADTGVMVGDAIDDILGIYGDLREVQRRWEHNSPEDALWFFKDLYGFHWGWHLRNLQRYVHDVLFGSWRQRATVEASDELRSE